MGGAARLLAGPAGSPLQYGYAERVQHGYDCGYALGYLEVPNSALNEIAAVEVSEMGEENVAGCIVLLVGHEEMVAAGMHTGAKPLPFGAHFPPENTESFASLVASHSDAADEGYQAGRYDKAVHKQASLSRLDALLQPPCSIESSALHRNSREQQQEQQQRWSDELPLQTQPNQHYSGSYSYQGQPRSPPPRAQYLQQQAMQQQHMQHEMIEENVAGCIVLLEESTAAGVHAGAKPLPFGALRAGEHQELRQLRVDRVLRVRAAPQQPRSTASATSAAAAAPAAALERRAAAADSAEPAQLGLLPYQGQPQSPTPPQAVQQEQLQAQPRQYTQLTVQQQYRQAAQQQQHMQQQVYFIQAHLQAQAQQMQQQQQNQMEQQQQ